MPTLQKLFTFVSDAEGLADSGNHAGITFAHVSGDGNPSGCVRFNTTSKNLSSAVEFARNASTGETWETWGIPAGATVTQVQVNLWDEKLQAKVKLSAHSIKARIIDSAGVTVHSAGDLLDVTLDTTVDTAWQAGAAGTARAVDAAKQASTTDVRLELEYTVSTAGGGGTANEDWRIDQITVDMTYSEPPQQIAGAGNIGGGEAHGASALSLVVAPSGLSTAEAFGTASVSSGLTISPSAIASSEAVGQPGINQTLYAGALSSAEAFGSAGLSITVSPSAIVSGEVFGTASISSGLTLFPSGIASAEEHGSGALSLSLSAAGGIPAQSAGDPSISMVLSAAGAVSSSEAFGSALVSTPQTVSDVGQIASATVFGGATVIKPPKGKTVSVAVVRASTISVAAERSGTISVAVVRSGTITVDVEA